MDVKFMKADKLNIWGRDFELLVVYECSDWQAIDPAQADEAKRIASGTTRFSDSSSVLDYVKKDSGRTEGNIFSFVVPYRVMLRRPDKDGKCSVAILCDYRYDPEHGLVVVYKDGVIRKIGPSDVLR